MDKPSIKIEVETVVGNERATKVDQHDYHRGHEDRMEFFWEFLGTLAPNDFHQERYIEAYLKYIEDCRQAGTEDKDPKLVDFIPPVFDEDDLGDAEDTMPLDDEAASHDANND